MKSRLKILFLLSLILMSCGDDTENNTTVPEIVITEDGDTLEVAKENAIVSGSVKQSGKDELSNVAITLTSDSLKGIIYSDTTDQSGNYKIEGLLSGKYRLKISKDDFISKDTETS